MGSNLSTKFFFSKRLFIGGHLRPFFGGGMNPDVITDENTFTDNFGLLPVVF